MIRFARYIACTLLLCFAQSALAQTGTWAVSEASGSVTIHDGTGDHPARRGTAVPTGATLSTGPGARAVMVRGKDFMTVNANSRVRVAAPAQGGGLFDILQEWGNALFQIEKKPNPHFGVRTPYLAAVVKGTTFSITVTEKGSSLQVVEGAVETSTLDGGARDIIRPGVVAIVSAGDRYRLTVQGQERHSLDSPQRTAPDAPGSASAPATQESTTVPGSSSGVEAHSDANTRIETPIQSSATFSTDVATAQIIDRPVAAGSADLGKVTDGLVAGSSAAQVASIEVAAVGTTTAEIRGANDNGKGNGAGNGNANGSGNGNANGSGNGNANGSGNGNANGSGNGNANGSGNGNANGSGNGNANGSGNGNANGSGNGNANGSGNGNANGSGNGNANGSGNGNANGSGNGNANGSGNGNANGSGNGNANGSGNGNANGSGNGNANGSGNGNANGSGNGNANGSGNGNANGSGNGNANGSGNGNANGSGNGNANGSGNGNANGSGNGNANGSGNGNANGSGNGNANGSGNGNANGSGNGNANGSGNGNANGSGNGNANGSGNGNANGSGNGNANGSGNGNANGSGNGNANGSGNGNANGSGNGDGQNK